MITNTSIRRIDSYNCRNYVEYYNIAKNALETITKIENEIDCGLFTPTQLRIIAYDYTFATGENFLEHIGYILFDN